MLLAAILGAVSDRWEYWTVEVTSELGLPEIQRTLAYAGSEGWELVSTTAMVSSAYQNALDNVTRVPGFRTDTRSVVLIFKRRMA